MTKLIAFDLEGILVKEEFLVELAKTIDKQDEVRRITEEGLSGKRNWEEGLKKRIDILKGMDYKTVKEVSRKFTVNNEVVDILQLAKCSGFKTAVISGGFRIFAEGIVKKLGIDYLVCNDFVFEDGKLSGYKLSVNNDKGRWLKKFAEECHTEFTIAIGDGENDLGMIKAADFGILTNCKNLNVLKGLLKNIR